MKHPNRNQKAMISERKGRMFVGFEEEETLSWVSEHLDARWKPQLRALYTVYPYLHDDLDRCI